MKQVLIGLGILCAALTAMADTNAPSAQENFEMGVRFMQEKKFAGAVDSFQQAIAARPDFFEAYNNLGISLVQLGKQGLTPQKQLEFYQGAADKFAKAAELRPNERITYMLWSETLLLIGDLPVDGKIRLSCYQGAVERCRKAVELAPLEWEAYNKWAVILSTKLCDYASDDPTRLKIYREAADLFAKAAEHARFSGELAPIYSNWGSTLVRAARLANDPAQRNSLLAAAVEKFERSARAVPNAAATYAMWGGALVERGKLSRVRGDLRDAIDRLNTSLALNPKDPTALYNLAIAYALMDNCVMAVDALKKCFALDANKAFYNAAPQDPDLMGCRGDVTFQELFSASIAPGLPSYNPRLGDAPR